MAPVRKSSAARSVLESCERRQGAALSITRVSGVRLSSGGAVLNSVRLSLLLACVLPFALLRGYYPSPASLIFAPHLY